MKIARVRRPLYDPKVISFVCSIGNVPLAGALWKGGISFSGVVSFIFADLIAMLLLLVYRKLYGTRMTLRMLGFFWALMSIAGLATEGISQTTGLVPATRPNPIVAERVSWNYTTFLNLVFLGVLVLLYLLSRSRARLGGGTGYAIDPVCQMQVETTNAPTSLIHDDRTIYFCLDRCRDRFVAEPARFARRHGAPSPNGEERGHHINQDQPTEGEKEMLDPVCGKTVEPKSAAAHRNQDGIDVYFCCVGCAARFDNDPRPTWRD